MLSEIMTILAPAFCPFITFFTKLHYPRCDNKMVFESLRDGIELHRFGDSGDIASFPFKVVP